MLWIFVKCVELVCLCCTFKFIYVNMLHARPMSIEKNEMGRVCSMYGGEERHIQGFVGKS